MWNIKSSMTLDQLQVATTLPLEHALFLLATNIIIVSANFAFDRCLGIIQLHPSVLQDTTSIPITLWRAHISAALSEREDEKLQVLESALSVLHHSKFFYTASFSLPFHIRLDLTVLYALLRVADNMVDDPSLEDASGRRAALGTVRELMEAVYGDFEGTSEKLRDRLPEAAISSARAYRSLDLHKRLSKEYMLQLLDGFEIDIDIEKQSSKDGAVSSPKKDIRNLDDFVEYAEGVAGSVGSLMHQVFVTSTSRFGELLLPSTRGGEKLCNETIARSARDVGIYLQFVNNARDIVDDSRNVGRCYVPTAFFSPVNPQGPPSTFKNNLISPPEDFEFDFDPQPYIRYLALQFLDSGKGYYERALPWLHSLPSGVRGQVRAAYETYKEYDPVIREREGYPKQRAKISTWRRLRVGFKALIYYS
jgi:15-cis-phytoene synthase/lycopene beta-cyclase